MDIPINAEVFCQDNECGKTTCVIIKPIEKLVTHIVVKEKGFIGIERLIPIEKILESSADQIILSCSVNEFYQFEPFMESRYIRGEDPSIEYEQEHYYYHPHVTPDVDENFEYEPMIEQIECIPPDQLAIHRGADVKATDGKVGEVGEFLVNPVDKRISHLVLKEGHLWNQKLVTIPLSEIDHLETDLVYIKLSKQEIGSLPEIPVERHYFWKSR